MPIRRPLLAIAISALAGLAPALLAPGAEAAWFPGESIDGPSPDIVSVGDVDVSRDGTGGVVYLKREGGVAHAYLSRIIDGAWRPPERVDAGLDAPVTAATIAAGDGRRLAIGFVSGGKLYGTFAAGGGQLAPLSPPALLADGSLATPVTDPHSDLGINGTAYIVFAAGGDVRAVRLQDTTWDGVAPPLDVDPGQAAGEGVGRPRIAVSAEGNAVATWAENHADGRRRVYGRRITELTPSAAPQEISLPDLGGAPGGPADSPDIDIEDDGSFAWVAFRQDFGGGSRTVARRLVGSLFEAPAIIDGGQTSYAPRFDMNSRGIGAAVAAGPDGSVVTTPLEKTDAFAGTSRLDASGSADSPSPVVAVTERRQTGVVWRSQPVGANATIQARFRPDEKPWEPEATISVPDFGPVVGAPELTSDRNGDFAAAFIQGPTGARRVVVAVFDKPPGTPIGQGTSRFQRRRQPRLVWSPGADLWGAQQYKVFVDGVEIATTDRHEHILGAPLPDGLHRWSILTIDRRGQMVRSRDRALRIDTTPPAVKIRVTGKRKRGRVLRVTVTPRDPNGSGINAVVVDYGDGSPTTTLRKTSHRYRRNRTFTLRVRVSDRAKNVTRETMRLRIKK
jgi:hypothetical protein